MSSIMKVPFPPNIFTNATCSPLHPSHPIPSHPPVASDHQGEEHRRDAWRETHQTHGFLVIAVWQDVIMRPVDSRQLIIYIFIYSIRISWGVVNAYDHVIDDAKWNYSNTLSWRIIYHFIFKRTDFNKAFSVYTCRAFPPCCCVAISEM